MNRDFKFRHVNEIAGVFVIGAVCLFVAGIIFAGKSQGWFEPRFAIHIVFETAEGSFGLTEGASVLVRNTIAGRVGPVLPTEDGLMGTTLILKDRFRPFITTDSIAKIKKKFGLAGDSYVDIERGQGEVIKDGAYISCVKDEELIETAQRMLEEVQEKLVPIFEQVESIINSVASILDQVDKGAGIAGAAVGDSRLRDDMSSIVSHLEKASGQGVMALNEVNSMLSNDVARVLGHLVVLSGQAEMIMKDDLPVIASETVLVQQELKRTLSETSRLLTGFQRHWLLRRYIEQDSDERDLLLPATVGAALQADRHTLLINQLESARLADNATGIRRYAFHLAVHELGNGDRETAQSLIEESRFAARLTERPERLPDEVLLEAEIHRQNGNFEQASKLVESVIPSTRGRTRRRLHAETRLLQLAILIDSGQNQAANSLYPETVKAIQLAEDSPLLNAALYGLKASLRVGEGSLSAAAESYARQADFLRKAGAFAEMAAALGLSAEIYSHLGMSNSAATYYLRAAVSLAAQGHIDESKKVLLQAGTLAEMSGDSLLASRIADTKQKLNKK